MKICIVGTHKSGSTRLFNLIRLMFEKKGKKVYTKWNICDKELVKLENTNDIVLCKIHDNSLDYINNYDIKILPIRNILDSAISSVKRYNNKSIDFFKQQCIINIKLYKKFKDHVNFIFKYENYNIFYVKQLCTILNISLNNHEIIDIMKVLDKMHKSKSIVKNDDHNNKEYRKTLLSQQHNTSNGQMNKFVNLNDNVLTTIFKVQEIVDFLEETEYI